MPAQTRLEQELFPSGGKITLEPLGGLNIGKYQDPYRTWVDTSHSKAEYPISNEYCDENAMRRLEKWRGKYYLGVAGGGTNILYQLSKILPDNDLKGIHVVDKDERQLYNFGDVVGMYNRTWGTTDYRSNLLAHAGEKCSCIDATPNRERPMLPRDITIHVEHGLIEDCVRGIKEKGRHFINLSNCLFSEYADKDSSYRTLETIISNKNIEDGSVVFLYFTGPGGGALMLEKWGDILASEDGSAICIPKLKRFVPSPPHRDLKHYPCVFY